LKTFLYSDRRREIGKKKEAGWVHMVTEPTGDHSDHSIGRLPQSKVRVNIVSGNPLSPNNIIFDHY
jgi:hypothetical protein